MRHTIESFGSASIEQLGIQIPHGGPKMSRQIRLAAIALLVGFGISLTGCSDLNGPSEDTPVSLEIQGSNT
jgi:hypothetical protein